MVRCIEHIVKRFMTNFNRHMVGDSCNAGAWTTGDGRESKKKVLVGNVGGGAVLRVEVANYR